jgi:hypothetical protein
MLLFAYAFQSGKHICGISADVCVRCALLLVAACFYHRCDYLSGFFHSEMSYIQTKIALVKQFLAT